MPEPTYTLGLLKIPVSDVMASARFYREGLGFEQQFVVPEYGWAQFQAGELSIGLYVPGLGGGNRAPGGSMDFHFAASDLEAVQTRLKRFNPAREVAILTRGTGSHYGTGAVDEIYCRFVRHMYPALKVSSSTEGR